MQSDYEITALYLCHNNDALDVQLMSIAFSPLFTGYDEIPALGRELGLTCSQLDEVDRYRTSGLSQMFWQICREYSFGQSETCSVTQMVGALAKIGINIEGKK